MRVAIAGVTGAVGREMLRVLEQRDFAVDAIRGLASERSRGRTFTFRGADHPVEVLGEAPVDGVDLALFAAGAARSRAHAPAFAAAGALVVDNSSAFRMEADVPLVVPEVNGELVRGMSRGIIANPNCSTIIMVMALAPLHRRFGVRRVVVSTYQAVSGVGLSGIDEFRRQLADPASPSVVFPHPIWCNCIPQVDVFADNAYTREEMKMVGETRKILGEPELAVSATCVRVPIERAHSEAVWIETARPIAPEAARQVLRSAPGVRVVDDPAAGAYPLAADASGSDDVLVGRIRSDLAFSPGLAFWVVGDQLLKGAALNAVQVAEVALGG